MQLTEEELEYRMKQEYLAYLDEEDKFLRELGLKEDAPEVLPPMDWTHRVAIFTMHSRDI